MRFRQFQLGARPFSLDACSSILLLIFSILFTFGCAGTKMALTSPSSPTSPSNPTSPGSLSVSASTVSFGNVQVGSTKSMSLTLSNGTAQTTTIEVSQVTVSGQAFSMTGVTLPTSLAPGHSLTLTIDFKPSAAGNATGTVAITSDTATANISVALSGSGMASGQLAVNPATMTFSAVAVGSGQNQSGTLAAGSSPITVSSANWQGSGFSLSGITFPVTIPSGQSVPFTVTFTPQSSGTVSGAISFVSNASNSPLNETLAGTGQQSATPHSVDLSWNPDASSVQGYYVYRGNQTGGPYTKISALLPATSYVDPTVTSGQRYYYVVTALGSNSAESAFSNEAIAVIP